MDTQALSDLIRILKYTRYLETEQRRETYEETITRVITDYQTMARGLLSADDIKAIRQGMLNKRVFGSMRMLAMAGPAFERSNIVAYNCAALPVDRFDSLHDLMLLGMNGVGVTYSVERRHIEQFPTVKALHGCALAHRVEDTSGGWARALDFVIRMSFAGFSVNMDYIRVRPAGAVLRTKGGRASGPEPLRQALAIIASIIWQAGGRKLTALEWSDICCWIGEATVQGGIRRTALMALFSQGDLEMEQAKASAWHADPVARVRSNANFSQAWEEDSTRSEFDRMLEIMLNGNGEPGFFNRAVAFSQLSQQRRRLSSDVLHILPNPCGEAILDPFGLCNLSVVVARAGDTAAELVDAVQIAAMLSVLQANATYFPELRLAAWRENAEQLRQCGTCLTGITDSAAARDPLTLQSLYYTARGATLAWADKLRIEHPTTFTSVKPAGHTSLFTNSSPGVNPRHFKYARRRVTLKRDDPVTAVLRLSGVPLENSVYADNKVLAFFPLAAPEGALTLSNVSAIEQLELYLNVASNYSDQAVSVTINFEEGEQGLIREWLWSNRDEVVSLTFFKNDGKQYAQMPIEELTQAEYEQMASAFPEILWELLPQIENSDYTEGSSEVGCSGGTCSIM